MMSWIKHIPYEAAAGKLRQLYDRIKGPNNNVDNVMLIHSLRPHTLEGHMTLYKHVLHHRDNQLPKWYLECVGVYVSILNACDYCRQHHSTGMGRLIGDEAKTEAVLTALRTEVFEEVFTPREIAGLRYARLLSRSPQELQQIDIQSLRDTGYDDGEILELNQLIAYFHYANRTVLGLGVSAEGDILGLSPSNGQDDQYWQHQ
ncbi:MAG: peroxidase-related enzyme [Bacteroidota bacterium]